MKVLKIKNKYQFQYILKIPYFLPTQSFGFSIIHWKTALASRFLEAIKKNIGKSPIVNIIIKISSLLKPISVIEIAKYKIKNVTFKIIT